MATHDGTAAGTDAAIIARMVHPDEADLTEDAAEAVLRIFRLDQSDQDRLHDLLVKNQGDALTPAEKDARGAPRRTSRSRSGEGDDTRN